MKPRKIVSNTFFYAGMIILSIGILVPIIFLFLTAIKSPKDFYATSIFSLPETINWINFPEALLKGDLDRYMLNGLIICLVKVPLGVFISALAAFAITRLKIWRPNVIFILFLIGMMIPMQITLVPLKIGLTALSLTNTYIGIIIVYLGFGMPFGILVMRGFLRTIPKEIDDSARIDGCSNFTLFLRILMPISKPAIATLLILDFLYTWNEFVLISVLITDSKMFTVPAGLFTFIGQHDMKYSLLTAGTLITIVPVLIIYVIFQRYFVEGMAGAVKG